MKNEKRKKYMNFMQIMLYTKLLKIVICLLRQIELSSSIEIIFRKLDKTWHKCIEFPVRASI